MIVTNLANVRCAVCFYALVEKKRIGALEAARAGGRVGKKAAEMKFSTQHTVRVLAGVILLISVGGCDLVATKIGDYKQFAVPNVDTYLILDDINAQKIKITMSTSAKVSAFMNNIFTFVFRIQMLLKVR